MSTVVGVVMGSDSDWKVMGDAVTALDEFGIAYEVDAVSAHRILEDVVEYGCRASERGLRAIIVGAGGVAHLLGMPAALTSLSVIGVLVPLWCLDGMDSLLSIVQMPAGVPMATVLIAGVWNAGLLVAHIIGSASTGWGARDRMTAFQGELREAARAKGAALRERLED